MGINMPARTVLFTNARKFDGKDFRWVSKVDSDIEITFTFVLLKVILAHAILETFSSKYS